MNMKKLKYFKALLKIFQMWPLERKLLIRLVKSVTVAVRTRNLFGIKGSSVKSPFIFEIDIGKRIRHTAYYIQRL